MRYKIVTILAMIALLILGGCTTQEVNNDEQGVPEEIEEVKEALNEADIDLEELPESEPVTTKVNLKEDKVEITVGNETKEMDVEFEETTEVDTTVPSFTGGDFCPEGETIDIDTEDGSVDAEIIGMTTFKGKEYCEGFSVTTLPVVGEVKTSYYFSEGVKEIWVVANVNGQVMETFVEN